MVAMGVFSTGLMALAVLWAFVEMILASLGALGYIRRTEAASR